MNGKNSSLKLFMIDHASALIAACCKEFCGEDMATYVDRTYITQSQV